MNNLPTPFVTIDQGLIAVSFWVGDSPNAIYTVARLDHARAEKLIAQLTSALVSMPREASADDLGIAA